VPDIADRHLRGAAARRAAGRAYGWCARPIGLRALDAMGRRGLPAELEPALRVLLGEAPAPQARALANRLERWRAALSARPEVYRYAYDERAAQPVRWPDDAARADGEEVSLRWLASAASVPERWGLFLHMCAQGIGARTVLELGAGTGMSGAYLAAASCVESLLSLEGSPPLARVAAETLAQVSDRARVVEGAFEAELPRVLAGLHADGRRLDLAYIDGHHDEVATLAYLAALRPHLRRGALVVLDDIRLWRGMWEAWGRARTLPGVAVAIDTGRFGLLVWDEEAAGAAACFDLARYTGRSRVGPRRPQPHGQRAGRATTEAVTVVIPIWGKYADHRLDRAIESIRAQDVPVSILLVDNAAEPPLARPGVTILRSDSRVSLGAARNLGLQAVRSPTVLFWDADDVMLGGALARLLDTLDRRPDVVACACPLIDAVSGSLHHWPRRWPMALSRVPILFIALNAITSLYPVIGAAIRTAPAQEIGFPEVDGGDDWVLAVSLSMRGRVALDDRPGRLYSRHDESLSYGWRTRDVLTHARLVRARLREDPMVPGAIRALAPVIWVGQHAVLRVLRPLARWTPARRRAGA
jgi:predicted O-methyltransferase YrrM